MLFVFWLAAGCTTPCQPRILRQPWKFQESILFPLTYPPSLHLSFKIKGHWTLRIYLGIHRKLMCAQSCSVGTLTVPVSSFLIAHMMLTIEETIELNLHIETNGKAQHTFGLVGWGYIPT